MLKKPGLRLATAISVMDDIDEIDTSHPETGDTFAAYIADGGIEDRNRFYETRFRRKTFRSNFHLKFWTNFHPKTPDKSVYDNFWN
jgi:hypothetical protein